MEFEKSFKRKRLLSFIISAGYSLVGGVEYVVILPTAWDYLQTLGVTEEYWLGFTISVYSFAAAIAGVIGGRIADVYINHTKTIVLISIILRAFGSFQYTLGLNVWNILCSRLICGVGNAAGTALLAEICRTTTTEERTPYLSISNAMFELGILVGPAFQFILSFFHFSRRKDLMLTIGQGNDYTISLSSERYEVMQASINVGATYEQYIEDFLRDSFVLLLSMIFIIIFYVAGIETVIPVMTQSYFGYGVFENSLIYMVGGAEALVMFFTIGFIGRYVRDTTLQIIGWALILFSQIWLMFVIPTFDPNNEYDVIKFMVGVSILYLGNPIAFVSNTGLLSKVLSNETQGLGQGFCRLALYLGLIFGPSWAGSTVKQPYLLFGVCIIIMLINGVMLAMSFKGLRRAEDELKDSHRRQLKYEKLLTTNKKPQTKNNWLGDDMAPLLHHNNEY
ncbi:unnamed protein product [Allacma fusca]|uniref:Major facilitator superfamily (MFS) profile domain-containing protein n=1 Tax=Allacma fusca TaxID=39272 RepID=A0A8J2KMM9_9HEXA|nr:unnamed protein product [Allacma fusca]